MRLKVICHERHFMTNLVFINKFVEKYNYMLNNQKLLYQFVSSLYKIPVDIKEKICFLV